MASKVFRFSSNEISRINFHQIRHGHHMRGKNPTEARTLQERITELEKEDPETSFKVNIGLPVMQLNKKEIFNKWIDEVKKNRFDPNKEKLSRKNELIADLKKVKNDWLLTNAPFHKRTIAEHYGIFKDLYGDAFFHPVVPLTIKYNVNNTDDLAPVHTGNILKPEETSSAPNVTYDAETKSLWTLLMTSPDGHFSNPENEYCHWFIGNIPENQIDKGEQLIDYMRPLAPRGIGYCRYIFVLYKQNKHIDYSNYKKSQPCLELDKRDWNTHEFYKNHQDDLTPAGLAFFQASWDISLREFYRNTLQMKEPTFEYDFPKPYLKPQTWFPKREAFNRYLDRYRDPKEINKELLLKKLKKTHPFKGPEPQVPFPGAIIDKKFVPTWLQVVKQHERLKLGRFNDVE